MAQKHSCEACMREYNLWKWGRQYIRVFNDGCQSGIPFEYADNGDNDEDYISGFDTATFVTHCAAKRDCKSKRR